MTHSHAISIAVVGCRMGLGHAKVLAALKEYRLAAVCDMDEAAARKTSDACGGAPVYSDYKTMLKEVSPEAVVIATPNKLHALMTIEAAEAGVKGIYCEKPMASSLGEAKLMMAACEEQGALLIVGHQRRMDPVYRSMREYIVRGAIGELQLLRGSCAGDVLSDGTHTIDSMLYLSGEVEVNSLYAAVFRRQPDSEENPWAFTGWRYGHAVESAAMATIEFKSGIRAEMLTGDLRMPGRKYQDIEAIGTAGKLWIPGDQSNPPLLLTDSQAGGWRAAELLFDEAGGLLPVYKQFAQALRHGEDHPLNGSNAYLAMEIVMGVYESARTRAPVKLPLRQERFPLELMLEEHAFIRKEGDAG
jgi:predicted dehydrogenase